jgi:flavin reductase (DIM6/NTAB) family NADH-FMN oxidoreductase RutF
MIKVIPLKYYDGGFMTQAFAFGGTRDKSRCEDVKYGSSLQNFLIDDGNEVILSDTGLPNDAPDMGSDPNMPLSMGKKLATFKEAFEATGYKVEDVTKIVVTHKHEDHTGELRMFPNAKIYISEREADDMGLTGDNVVRVKFTDGAYKNFPESQRITDSLVMIKAVGHTFGNSISILEDKENDLYYMFQGDVTYCDAALQANELSIVFDDKDEARKTLTRVREFIRENRTIYCSTHCPEGYLNVEQKKFMQLENIIDSTSIHNMGYGLYVLTTQADGFDNGCIINTAMQVTSRPLQIAVCVNKANKTNEMIKKSKKFNLSVLTQDSTFEIYKHFGFQSGNDIDKFETFSEARRAQNGIYYISKNTNSFICCDVKQVIEFETHTMFVGEVVSAECLNDKTSVTYEYYQNNIKSKNQITNKKGWICKTCGYIYEGDELPDDFICPICKHGVEDFQKL